MTKRSGSGASHATPALDPVRRLASVELFGQGNEVRICHGPDEYRLRITRQGKLILTK